MVTSPQRILTPQTRLRAKNRALLVTSKRRDTFVIICRLDKTAVAQVTMKAEVGLVANIKDSQ